MRDVEWKQQGFHVTLFPKSNFSDMTQIQIHITVRHRLSCFYVVCLSNGDLVGIDLSLCSSCPLALLDHRSLILNISGASIE